MSPADGYAKALMPFLARGNAIRAAREQVGVSQAEIAAAIGKSQAYISGLETGARKLTETMTLQIWDALNWCDELARTRL
jgi:predicted transcriptional regulator